MSDALLAGARQLLAQGDLAAADALVDESRKLLGMGRAGLADRALVAREELLVTLGVPETDSRWGWGWRYRSSSLRLLGKLDDAQALGQRAVRAAQRHGWSDLLVEALWAVGRLHLEQGEFDVAGRLFQRALALTQELGNRAWEGECLSQLASVAHRRGEAARALQLHDQALAILEAIDDAEGLANALKSQAVALRGAGELDRAEAGLARALVLFEAMGSAHGVAECLWARSAVLLHRGRPEEAVPLLERAREIYEASGWTDGLARSWNALGEAWRAQGDLDNAEIAYRSAMEALTKSRSDQVVLARVNLGLIELARGAYDLARTTLDDARRTLDRSGRHALGGAVRLVMLPCDVAMGDFKAWEAHYQRGTSLVEAAGIVDYDIARSASLSGDLAGRRVGEPEALARATRSHALALHHWSRLGRDAEVEHEVEALRRLAAGGAETPLGPFDLLAPIGSGAMGQVWRGVHRLQGVPVAVKVLTHEVVKNPKVLEAFRNEVRAMAGLDHPNIALILDSGEVGRAAEVMTSGMLRAGSPYLAMELATAGALEDRVGRLDWPTCRSILLDLLDALAHAHARGVVHRDLKPANVLLVERPDGALQPKLTDFGLAHALGSQGAFGRTSGTPQYMAPEQIEGRWRDFAPETDLYALACLAWDLVTGRPPFGHHAQLARIRSAQLREPFPELVPTIEVPEGFEAWVRRLAQKDPRRRYHRAADAAAVLAELGESVAGARTGQAPPVDTWLSESSTLVAEDFDGIEVTAGGTPVAESVEDLAAADPAPLPPTWRGPRRDRASHDLTGAGLGLFGLRALPVVGRERRQDALWAALVNVAGTGRPRVVVLRGGAGVGRTTVLDWLAERAHEVGAAEVLRASDTPTDDGSDAIRQALLRFVAGVGLSRDDLVARLSRVGLDPVTGAELLLPGGADLTFQGPGERHAAAAHFLAWIARDRPVLFTVDDAQWGHDILAFARGLLDLPVPALVVLAIRDEDLASRPLEVAALASLLEHDRARELDLRPLPERAHQALVRKLLGLEARLADEVAKRTRGNPSFAVHLVGDWVQRGLLRPTERGFVLHEAAEITVPDGVHEAWSARTDTLVQGLPGARTALELAALLGTHVPDDEWRGAAEALGLEIPDGLLERCLSARVARAGEGGWSFVHGVMRESLLRSAEEAGTLARLHGAVAQMLRDSDEPGRRGRHLVDAGDLEAALDPLVEAARRAYRAGEQATALALLDVHDKTLQSLVIAEGDRRWAVAAVVRGPLLLESGDLDAAEDLAEELLADGERHGWATEVAEAHRLLASVHYQRGMRDRAEHHHRSALKQFKALGDAAGEGRSWYGLAMVERARGDLDAAAEFTHRAFDCFERVDDRSWGAKAMFALGALAVQAGDRRRARGHLRWALTRYEQAGERTGIALCLNALGDLERKAGNPTAATDHFTRSLGLFRQAGSGQAVFPLLNLGLVHMDRGAWGDADAALSQALALLEAQGRLGLVGNAHALLLSVVAVGDDDLRWDQHLRLARTLLKQTGAAEPDTAGALEVAASRALMISRPDRAFQALDLAREHYERLGRAAEVARVAAILAEAPASARR